MAKAKDWRDGFKDWMSRPPIVKIDPTSNPDGLCWTVVKRWSGEEVSRERFADEKSARTHANQLVGKSGCLIHIEGPTSTRGQGAPK